MQHCTDLPRQVTFPAHTEQGKDGTRVRINVAAHQKKEKNQKTAKRKTGEDRPILKRLRSTLLRLFRGLHDDKMVCVRGVLEVTGTLRKANSHFGPAQTGWGPHHHVEAAVDWSVQFCSLYMYLEYYIYDRNFALHYPKRSESIRVLGTDRKSVMMIRVLKLTQSQS